jgi:hypothetical protein
MTQRCNDNDNGRTITLSLFDDTTTSHHAIPSRSPTNMNVNFDDKFVFTFVVERSWSHTT